MIRKPSLLPPRALLISLLVQIPGIALAWPAGVAAGSVLAGVAALLAGAALNIWPVRLFEINHVGVCPFSAVPRLVLEGPYRWTRNPMYLGLTLIAASLSLIAGPAWNVIAPCALAMWLHFRFVLPEERFLEDLLGIEYLRYASRTPRWIGLPPAAAPARSR